MKRILMIALFLIAHHAMGGSASDVLQKKLNEIGTMSANFKQRIDAKKKEVSRSSGTMALSRPGRFRWQTKQPMQQLVVADGKRLWVYDVELEQVTVKKQEQGIGGTAALFLSGYNDTVARDFNVTEQQQGNKTYYDLKSKSSKANFQKVRLIFEKNTLVGMELFDQLGQHTLVNLTNVKTNLTLSASLFKFTPPKGVDVVKQ